MYDQFKITSFTIKGYNAGATDAAINSNSVITAYRCLDRTG